MENIYLIKLKDKKEEFYKIGLSVHRYCRFYEIMKLGYNIEIIYMIFGIEFYEAMSAEMKLHQLFDPYIPLKKFGGYTECFSHIDIKYYKQMLFSFITSYTEITENLKITWR